MNKLSLLSITILLIANSINLSIDSNDLMNGQGLFLTSSVSAYSSDSIHMTSFVNWNGSNILKLIKPDSASVSYQNGLQYSFQPTKIKHIQFKFASSNPDTQDSNLRLMNSNLTTLILFRAGRGGLIRVNQKQMISFYNSSVSSDLDIKLTQVDFLIKWEQKIIEVFVNNKFADKCDFFNNSVTQVSQILLYNLYSSTSYWSDIVVCQEICYSFNFNKLLQRELLMVLIIMILYISF